MQGQNHIKPVFYFYCITPVGFSSMAN